MKKKPNLLNKKDECCGCTACATVCPLKAISFEYDHEGFLYSSIDYDICIGCLKCENVCAFKKDNKFSSDEYENTKVYAAKAKCEDVLLNSSSGGMFTIFSDIFLEQGDAVGACKYVSELDKVTIKLIFDKGSRDEARGSKYIQAELDDSFQQIIDYLYKNLEKKILVFGTGCQIAGLDLLLKKNNLRNRAILIDLVCHGAPSSGLWKKYIQKVEKNQNGKINFITFKNKRNGWEFPSTYVMFEDKEVSIKPYADWFYMGLTLRKSCYKCPYTKIDRNSDITIGDYWGIKSVMPDFYDENGVSLVITHTEVGNELFDKVKNKINWRESNRNDCLQPRLISPESCPKNRSLFWQDLQEKGMDYCIKKYIEINENSKKDKIKSVIKKVLKKFN